MYNAANLKKVAWFGTLAPAVWESSLAFNRAATAEGALTAKAKELIAVALAVSSQCPYCIDTHPQRARAAGCTDAGLTEAVLVAAALRSGGAITYETHCLLWREDRSVVSATR
jgi:AhpD family alkylhydroperoxidase